MQTRAAARARPPDTLAAAVARLRAAGTSTITHPPVSYTGDAAVLVGLFAESPTSPPRVLLTQRPPTLSTHAGEVCFPGGRSDPEDGVSATTTALREADEEVGLRRDRVVVLTTRPPVLSKHFLNVTPVVALLQAGPGDTVVQQLGLTLNPQEVEAAFSVPLALFVDGPSAPGWSYSHRDARFGPGGPPFRLHFFEVPGEREGSTHCVWGLTAGLLIDVASVALGRQPAFQTNADAAPSLDYRRICVGPDGRPAVRPEVDEVLEEAA